MCILPPPMASSVTQVAVFVDTSLGTHIAIPISPDTTVLQFKREFEKMHSRCFPRIGNVRANGLMVKRKSKLYHLPEWLPIKHAFQGLKGTWFIYIDAYPRPNSGNPCLSKSLAGQPKESSVGNRSVTSNHLELDTCDRSTRRNRTKRKRKKTMMEVEKKDNEERRRARKKSLTENCLLDYHENRLAKGNADGKGNENRQESRPCSLVETPKEMVSETVSVSGIIKKYFSPFDEVTSPYPVHCSNTRINAIPEHAPKTPLSTLRAPLRNHANHKSSRRSHSSNVGKRLVLASNNLRTRSKGKHHGSVCRFRENKLSVLKSSSIVRNLVFEISDEEGE